MRKELIRTANGAGTVVELFYDECLAEILNYLGKFFNIIGCVNFEFLRTENETFLMDINPRFSAGVAFSVKAGYDMIINHLRCFTNEKIVKADKPVQSAIFAKRFTDLPMTTICKK